MFEIGVASIVESDHGRGLRLFSRLQQGVPLILRDCGMHCSRPIRNEVEAVALSHPFFKRSRIPEARYRPQDYVAHLFAWRPHGTERDIKAPNLKHFYQEFDSSDTDEIMKMAAEVNKALTVLDAVNEHLGFTLRHKWIVTDLAWLIIQRMRQKNKPNAQSIATQFNSFDGFRREYTSAPELALKSAETGKKLGKHLYQYLIAFKLQGGMKSNVETRSVALNEFLPI